jgi:hypothetical protein
VTRDAGGFHASGELAVPPDLNGAVNAVVDRAAADAEAAVGAALADAERATKAYEVELSLRGMRKAIPAVADTAIATMNRQIRLQVDAQWPKPLGVEAPGKDVALKMANEKAEPHRVRLRALKSAVQKPDDAAARIALKKALSDVIAPKNRRLVVEVKPIGKLYDAEVLTRRQLAQIRTGIEALDALPAASDRKVKAADVYAKVPKREGLAEAGRAIRAGRGAVPRVTALAFRISLGRPGAAFAVGATVEIGGAPRPLEVELSPGGPKDLASAIGEELARMLD